MKKSMKALVIGNIITLGVTAFSMINTYNKNNTIDKLENKIQSLQTINKEQATKMNKLQEDKKVVDVTPEKPAKKIDEVKPTKEKEVKSKQEVKQEVKQEDKQKQEVKPKQEKHQEPKAQLVSYTEEQAPQQKESTEEDKLANLITPAMREQEIELSDIVKNSIKEQHEESNGDVIATLKDDSTILINKEQNKYYFYPAILGDWNYTFKNIGQLNMGVETYLEITPQLKRGQAILETNSYYQEDGDLVVEYNDGSWSVINEDTNKYIFGPANMGDWDLQLKNKEEFRNVVDTYKELAVHNS